MSEIDAVVLNFSPQGLFVLNLVLGVVMFGVALDLKLADFKTLIDLPKSAFIGLLCQFLLLPAVTFALISVINPVPSIALGMLLVAACPGGNISNFFTHVAKGNTALSVGMSAASTGCAMFLTPLNFAFWGSLYAPATALLTEIALDPFDLAKTIFLLLALPLALGLTISHRFPDFAERMKKPMRIFSMAVFGIYVFAAWILNFDYFLAYVGLVVIGVFIHNTLALTLGYGGAKLLRLPERDRRAVAIEVGIQNSGLGLILIFNFFGGLGGMAIVTAWWGIWHIISGMSLALFWSRRYEGIKDGRKDL